jgi:hypothetical protein
LDRARLQRLRELMSEHVREGHGFSRAVEARSGIGL